MPEQRVTRILISHFFRRFFENDTLRVEDDMQTTVIRALAMVAVPGLMFAFFLQNQYPAKPLWPRIEDEYFFVLFSFVVMGAVSIFEWEMLFPDRLDFLVLTPMPLRPLQMLTAKAAALTGFLALFLTGANLFGILTLPAITAISHHYALDILRTFGIDWTYLSPSSSGQAFFHQLIAHAAAVLMAGLFAALSSLALGGILLCVLGSRARVVTPIVQALAIMALVLLFIHYLEYGNVLQSLLTPPLHLARWMPPLWFLGLYEQLYRGPHAPAFAAELSRYAIRGTLIAAAIVLITYPTAWARMREIAIEGTLRKRARPAAWPARIARCITPQPGGRAVFFFISQTIARTNRYQVYLAMYCGTGLAIASACAFSTDQHGTHLALSEKGLHSAVPLLIFWTVAGLRAAFAFPINLPAGWIFRITSVDLAECAEATRRWVILAALSVLTCLLAALGLAGWDLRRLFVAAVCGRILSTLLVDGFFSFQDGVPFNTPRRPGRTNFALMLTLYIGVLPPFLFAISDLQMHLEKHLAKLIEPILLVAAAHILFTKLRSDTTESEELEGYDGEFQLLNLS